MSNYSSEIAEECLSSMQNRTACEILADMAVVDLAGAP